MPVVDKIIKRGKYDSISKNENLKGDSYSSTITGLGKKNKDKNTGIEFSLNELLADESLSDIYDGDGLGAKIIDIPVDDAMRKGWEIENDEKQSIEKEFERIKGYEAINKAWKYARLFRGSIIAIITDKGGLDDPLTATIGTIRQLRVFSAARIHFSSADIIDDPASPYFNEIEYYPVTLRDGSVIKIHASKCIIFRGEESSDISRLGFKYEYWGISILQKVWDRLKTYSSVEFSVANMLQEFTIGKYTVKDLVNILSMNQADALRKIYTRLEAIDASKSIINGVLLGEGEAYERDSANVSGLADLIDRYMMNLSAVAKIPVSRLFERTAAGLNATGEGDENVYLDRIQSGQELKLKPPLQKLTQLIASYTYKDRQERKITFNELKQLSEKEKAEIYKMNAEADNIYLQSLVLDSEQVFEKRFPELEYKESEFEEPIEKE